MTKDSPDADVLLTPREVAELFDVRTTTIARWARAGRLSSQRTLGGQRRYSRDEVWQLLAEQDQPKEVRQQLEEDAARLYDQGWNIRQVAAKFDCSYGVMRRILNKHVTLRNRSGTYDLNQPPRPTPRLASHPGAGAPPEA